MPGKGPAAAQLYAKAEEHAEDEETRQRARFKRAVALRQYAHDPRRHAIALESYLQEALATLKTLSQTASAESLRIEARALYAATLIEEGELEQGALVLAEDFEAIAGGNGRFAILNVLDAKAQEFHRKAGGERYDKLIGTFVNEVPHHILVQVGADNFRSVAEHWVNYLQGHGRGREAAELCHQLYEKMKGSASGAFIHHGLDLLCVAQSYEEALAWSRQYGDEILSVRRAHVAKPDLPLEEDPGWLLRLHWNAVSLEFLVLLRAERFVEAQELYERMKTELASVEGGDIVSRVEALLIGSLGHYAIYTNDREAMREAIRQWAEFFQRWPPQLVVESGALTSYLALHQCLGEFKRVVDLLEGRTGEREWRASFRRWRKHGLTKYAGAHVWSQSQGEAQRFIWQQRQRTQRNTYQDFGLQYLSGELSADEYRRVVAPRPGASYVTVHCWDVPLTLALGHELRGETEKARAEYEQVLKMIPWHDTDWHLARQALERLKQ